MVTVFQTPMTPSPWIPRNHVDTDGDGIGNNADTDDDGDGVSDANDAFPLDPDGTAAMDGLRRCVMALATTVTNSRMDSSEWEDSDGDGSDARRDASTEIRRQ